MLWYVSWQEIPAGSLPNDDELIAAKLGMSATWFAAHRTILMRNWYRASDGRLYNPTVVKAVAHVIKSREETKYRVRKHRAQAADSKDVKREVTDGNVLQTVTVTDKGLGVGVGVVVDQSQRRLSPAVADDPKSQTPHVNPIKTVKITARATRIDPKWQLPEQWFQWAKVLRTDWTEARIMREELVFRDFWLAKSGQGATKVDWFATWRNWIRRAM